MLSQTDPPVSVAAVIKLFNDRAGEETLLRVTPGLAALLAYADAWAREESRHDRATLTFSSTLAAMVAGSHPLCVWFRTHLALRGAAADAVTKGRTFPSLQVPVTPLTTTGSFRRALEKAVQLARGRTLDVKHLMAAYPVIPDYHAGDFLRHRIDRRAWCLALAEHLQRTEPAEERAEWKAYEQCAPEVLLPRYRPDVPAGADLLGVGREVEAFAMLLAARSTAMPLSIGLFGSWGSGKSYFMTRVEERVAVLAQSGAGGGRYLNRIAQVRFNAWHYSEGDVVASLVDQIFRNLRFGPNESQVVLAARRLQAQEQVTAADREWSELQRQVKAAEAQQLELREEWRRVSAEHEEDIRRTSAELEAAEASVEAAEQSLARLLDEHDAAVRSARPAATTHTARAAVAEMVLKDPKVSALNDALSRTAEEARWLGANRQTVALGIVLAALPVAAALLLEPLRNAPIITALTTAVLAVAPLAKRASTLLRDLEERGARFRAAVLERSQAAVEEVVERSASALREREGALAEAREAVEALRARLEALGDAARQAAQAVGAGEQRQAELVEKLTGSAAAASEARRRLDSLTLGSLLGDTIEEAGGTDIFRNRLGTTAHARSYLQRLSETMERARRDHAAGVGEPPVLERVVLYIDDLDRCPAPKVREVLQAVHLLLAFDLFACVVAVDPRWVLQCLADSPGVAVANGRNDTDLEVLGGMATPSDYLEKIFQIPIWLRPVPAKRRAALAATLLERDLETLDQSGQGSTVPFRIVGDSPVSGQGDPGMEDVRGAAVRDSKPPPSHREVQIDARELQFLQVRVAPLLDGNVRALKRFVNTYHLVKAALSEVEFESFADKSYGEGEPYRVCMAQLALLATQRKRARLLAQLVDQTVSENPLPTLGQWLDDLAKSSEVDRRSIGADLSAALLSDSPALAKLPFDRFAFWFERTRRYSFYL